MRRLTRAILSAALLCGLLCPRGAFAQDSAQRPSEADKYADKIQAFREFVRTSMPQDRIPGMTVGFTWGDYTWVEGFGYADLENRTPAKADSAYRLASITKSITGEAIVQLAERGRVDLDAEIQRYVPDYPAQKWPVTVRNLLTHTGGGQVGSGLGPEHVTTKEVVARISKYPIQEETGVRFNYQTAGYNLLGAAIENVSGKSFDEYLRENILLPAGMKDTGMDDVRRLWPNRVRGYEVDNGSGQFVNAPFLDVSSRFGGGGLTGTVPDLLRWPAAAFGGKILSPKWVDEMIRPFTSKSGRFTGIGDGDIYYTLGWMVLPVNGSYVLHAAGSQKGTETILYYFPERRLTIAVATNLQFAPTGKYARRLFELVTGDAWEARVYTRERLDAPVALALNNAYNYGALNFEERHAPSTNDAKELADAFAFFSSNVTREAARTDFQSASQRIRDARHPAGKQALIKLGSYMAARLKERNGAAGLDKYHRGGAIPFFADYVRLYKADSSVPKQLRFTPAFEKLIERWDADWSKTWNDYTRTLVITPDNLDAVGERLRKDFAGAEVYPDYVSYLQPMQQGIVALKAPKLGVELYPYSDELLFNLAYYIITFGGVEEGRAAINATVPGHEPPAVYLRRAYEANPGGVMRAQTFLDIGAGWLKRPERTGAGVEFIGAAAELHAKNAALHEMYGDFLLRAGRKAEAEAEYRKAFALDPDIAKGATLDAYLAGKTAPAPAPTPKP